jgi:hypothetical protein
LQGDGQLQPDDAGADDGHRGRQIDPVEHVVVDDEPVAEALAPARRNTRPGARRDDDGPGLDASAVHVQRVRVEQARAPEQPRGFGPAVHGLVDEADEAVAFAAHAGHDGPAVDARRVGLHAETMRLPNRLGRVGRGDEQLAGHAADPRTGRAVVRRLDEQHALGVHARRPISRHAGRAGANDRHVAGEGHDGRLLWGDRLDFRRGGRAT